MSRALHEAVRISSLEAFSMVRDVSWTTEGYKDVKTLHGAQLLQTALAFSRSLDFQQQHRGKTRKKDILSSRPEGGFSDKTEFKSWFCGLLSLWLWIYCFMLFKPRSLTDVKDWGFVIQGQHWVALAFWIKDSLEKLVMSWTDSYLARVLGQG